MRPLWPDIAVIRQRMLGAPSSEETAAEHDEPIVEAQALPMPAFVAEQIQRLDEVKYGVRAPAVGDVVLISKPGHSPIAVCLEAPVARNSDGARWRGWMVAAETDYATDKDVLLEESDGPCDPLAGMIETWNPLELLVPDSVRVLAHLSEYRMSIIREVARESHADTAELPRPGFIANRETASGRLVLTGTPLGKANDPRAEYQEIFRACAGAYASVSQMAIAPMAQIANQKQERGGFLAGLSVWLMGHRLAAGATALVAVVSGVVVSNMQDKAPTSAPTRMASAEPVVKQNPAPAMPVEPAPQQQAHKDVEPESRPVEPALKASQERAPKPAKPKQAEPQSQIASTPTELIEIRSILVPMKDQTTALAMRSGGEQPSDVKAYLIRLKPGADIDRAVEVLINLGFRIIRIDEGGVSLQVAISERRIDKTTEQKLIDTGFFIRPKSGE